MLHFVVHILAIANFAYAIYFDVYKVALPGRASFGGQWKFLTFWNMWIQLIYFSISLVNSVMGSDVTDKSSRSGLQKIRDFMFATLAFPIGQFVGIIFWSLWAIDRDLVFPEYLDKYIPMHINHMMHTTVIPAQFLELALLYHIYPSKKAGMAMTMSFCFVYLTWTMIIAYVANMWVYPIFAILDPVPRGLFMIFCSALGGMLYLIGDYLNQIIWSKYQDNCVGDVKKMDSTVGIVTRSKKKAKKAE